MFENFNNKLTLPSKIKLYFLLFKKIPILVVETPYFTKKYIKLPFFLKIKKLKNILVLENLIDMKFSNLIFSWFKKFAKPFKKQLILKGLGFKGSVLDNNSLLELKLGFSHKLDILLNLKDIKVSMNNNILTAEGFESDKVGNFLQKIRKLKKFDSYKGKGFWYKNEQRSLKDIKKI
jgi:hypothetical protein